MQKEIDVFEIPIQFNEPMAKLLSQEKLAVYLTQNDKWKKLRGNRDFSRWEYLPGGGLVIYARRDFDIWGAVSSIASLEGRSFLRVYRDVTRGDVAFVATHEKVRLVYA